MKSFLKCLFESTAIMVVVIVAFAAIGCRGEEPSKSSLSDVGDVFSPDSNSPPVCTAKCYGKKCGDDGCGGSCGNCLADQFCDMNWQCVGIPPNCEPDCKGKDCGLDGCGGSCGWCEPSKTCLSNGICGPKSPCEPACSGKQCGNDGCNGICGVCPSGSLCDYAGQCYVSPTGCVPTCTGKECGSNGCGGICGVCDYGESCVNDVCVTQTCTPKCTNKQCGDDGCGGLCGSCPIGSFCDSAGQCYTPPVGCTPNCVNKECGYNGCGGLCGVCDYDESCVNDACVIQSCIPKCTGKFCGDNGCGGLCGSCPIGSFCDSAGQCYTPPIGCTPNCANKECGSNGCGGICGVCDYGESCVNDACVTQPCTPKCFGKLCGDDGCGGICGSCPPGQTCDGAGQCSTPVNLTVNFQFTGTVIYASKGQMVTVPITVAQYLAFTPGELTGGEIAVYVKIDSVDPVNNGAIWVDAMETTFMRVQSWYGPAPTSPDDIVPDCDHGVYSKSHDVEAGQTLYITAGCIDP